MNLTEYINVHGMESIIFLQTKLPEWGFFFNWISTLGDPGLAFTLLVPLMAAINVKRATTLLATLVVCEWSNMILKWLFAGDRPFWWLHESPSFAHHTLPQLRQFPLTCETGPGMPSGHATLNTAAFFIVLKSLTTYAGPKLHKRFGAKTSVLTTRSLWLLYGVYIFLVMTSRIYIAAHFPHQCLAGVVIGICIALFISSVDLSVINSNKRACALTAFIFCSVVAVFLAYKGFGNDPMWTLKKALRWCVDRNYIHVDSTPFYALSRFSGQTLGLGLALASVSFASTDMKRFTLKMHLSLVVLNLAMGVMCHYAHRVLPSTIKGYYGIEFCLNGWLAYIVLAAMPYFVMTSSNVKPKIKNKNA